MLKRKFIGVTHLATSNGQVRNSDLFMDRDEFLISEADRILSILLHIVGDPPTAHSG